jgi:hypothetical protein
MGFDIDIKNGALWGGEIAHMLYVEEKTIGISQFPFWIASYVHVSLYFTYKTHFVGD